VIGGAVVLFRARRQRACIAEHAGAGTSEDGGAGADARAVSALGPK
jgi:hypothetical protein